jgi:hypothetical protein
MPSRPSAARARAALVALALAATAACYTDDETTAPGAVSLTLDTTAIDLGTREASTGTTPRRVLTLQNRGDASTGIIGVGFANGASGGLTVSNGTTGACGSHALAAGASCTIVVALGGQSSGPQSGTLLVAIDGAASPIFTVPVQGAIRSALTIAYQGTGHGTVSAQPAAAVHGCIGATNCSASAQSVVCTATCGLAIDGESVTLVATPDASSTFDGFVRAAGDSPCAPLSGSSCTLTLADLNSVTVRFVAK